MNLLSDLNVPYVVQEYIPGGDDQLITMGIYQVIQGQWQLIYYTDANAELQKI